MRARALTHPQKSWARNCLKPIADAMYSMTHKYFTVFQNFINAEKRVITRADYLHKSRNCEYLLIGGEKLCYGIGINVKQRLAIKFSSYFAWRLRFYYKRKRKCSSHVKLHRYNILNDEKILTPPTVHHGKNDTFRSSEGKLRARSENLRDAVAGCSKVGFNRFESRNFCLISRRWKYRERDPAPLCNTSPKEHSQKMIFIVTRGRSS